MDKSIVIERIYIYIPFPIIGGLIAVLFHEFVYKRVSQTIQESEDTDAILDKGDTENTDV